MRPPRIGQALLERVLPAADREFVLGDLEEHYRARHRERGPLRARLWYWGQLGREVGASITQRSGREAGMGAWIAKRARDVRYAVRSFGSTPTFTALSGLTLALGIAGATAMFTVVYGVLLSPLPFPESDRLVHLVQMSDRGGGAPAGGAVTSSGIARSNLGTLAVSYPNFEDLAAQVDAFEDASAWRSWGFLAEDPDGASVIRRGASVSAGFFRILRVEPALGRTFTEDEGRLGHEPVVVVSYDYWRDELGADPEVVGRAVDFGRQPYTVVGVAPSGFEDPVAAVLPFQLDPPVAWRARPPSFDASTQGRSNNDTWTLARLRDQVPLERARREVATVGERLQAEYPETNTEQAFGLRTAREARVGDAGTTLWALAAAVGLLLAIACANVANLFLARSTARTREMAVRTALGAGRSRLLAQLATESAVFSLASGVVGLGLATLTVQVVRSTAAEWLPRAAEVAVDLRVVLFAVGLSLATALLFGLAPALHATGRGMAEGLRQGRGADSQSGRRLRSVFAVAQLGLAVLLLSGMGLVLRSFLNLSGEELGVAAGSVMTAGVSLDPTVYDSREAQNQVVARLVEAVEALPGVRSGSAINNAPMSGAVNSTPVIREDRPPEVPSSRLPRYPVRTVRPGYFETVGMPLLRGRDFGPGDTPDSPPVALVNEALATTLYPDGDPLGGRVVVRGTALEIVGVVGNVRQFGPARPPEPSLYTLYDQETQPWMRGTVVLSMRVAGEDSRPDARDVRAAVGAVGPGLTLRGVEGLDELLARHLAEPRFRLVLTSVFALLALLLAGVGVGAVTGYSVARRTRELAVRQACGATPDQVLTSVFGSALRLAGLGVVLGLVGAASTGSILARSLYEVDGVDPVVFGSVALIMGAVAVLAAVPPGRRAVRVEPSEVLREE